MKLFETFFEILYSVFLKKIKVKAKEADVRKSWSLIKFKDIKYQLFVRLTYVIFHHVHLPPINGLNMRFLIQNSRV